MNKYFWFLWLAILGFVLSACTLDPPVDPCTKGDKKCEGNVFYECLLDGDTWDMTVCNHQHSLGAFCNVARVCVACNDDADCQSGDKQCVEHSCQPLSVLACTEGSTRCILGKASTCLKKAWENETICPNGCNHAGTACKAPAVCTTYSNKCMNGQLLTCNIDGQWPDVGVDCPQHQRCLDGAVACSAVAVCTTGNKKCENNMLLSCSIIGQWPDVGADCPKGEACLDGAFACSAVIVCTPGDRKCENGGIYICEKDSTWRLDINCESGVCLDNKACSAVVACTPGDKKCENGGIFTCNKDKTWGLGLACESGVCLDDKVCTELELKCIPKETKCVENQQYICTDAGAWSDKVIECFMGCDTKSIACAVCRGDEVKCEGNTRLTCNIHKNGFDKTVCGGSTPYCDGTKVCVGCRNNRDCKDDNAPICDNKTKSCTKMSATCSPGETVCIKNSEAKLNEFYTCGAGRLWSSRLCKTGQGCDDDAGCISPTSHGHDFESCSFENTSKYSPGSCVTTGAPDISFTSGMGSSSSNAIDGRSLQMASNTAILTASYGVQYLSIQVKNISSALTHVEVIVGSTTFIDANNMKDGVVNTFTNDKLKIPGPVDIVIKTSHPIVIDNLLWSDYFE